MNIAIFSTAYLPHIGGAEIAVKEITDRLKDDTFDLFTARLSLALPKEETIGRVRVHRVGIGIPFIDKLMLVFDGPRVANKLHRERSFDRVWSIMASYAGFAALRFKKQHPTVPYLLTLQEGDSLGHIYARVWFVWPWFRQIFLCADRIQAISSYLKSWAKRLGATCPIDVVPNGVDVNKFRDIHAETQKTNQIITVSRLVPKNGVSSLVSAMVFLPSDVQLMIVGSGPEEQKIKSLIEEKKLNNRVHLLGTVPNAELPHYLHSANVFCRPSLSEGLGISFLEAMAAGLPVVAPNVGGISDFLKDGETGLFCVNDPKDIAEKIQKILTDKELYERLRSNGFALMKERYDWNVIAPKIQDMFVNI